MSFKSILQKVESLGESIIGKVDTVANAAVPIGDVLLAPVLGPEGVAVLNLFLKGINGAETLITTAQQGAAKKETAGTIIGAELTQLPALIQSLGVTSVSLPSTAPAQIGAATDALVTALNNISALIDSLKPPAK